MNNILVTGATGGMGKAICKRLAGYGYTVYGLDYREPDTELSAKFFCLRRHKNRVDNRRL